VRNKIARRSRTAIVVTATVAVVAGAIWVGVAAHARDSLSIYMDGQAFVCATGTATFLDRGYQDDEGSVPVIELTKDLDCTLRFHAANDGSLPLDISRITIPMAGPDSSGGASVKWISGGDSPAYPLPANPNSTSGRDALVDFDSPIHLEPGESQFFQATLLYPPDPAMSEGASSTILHAPSATVSAWGIAGEREGQRGGYGFVGTTDSDRDH
jgi:hypothetical protein